jgi:hypothetical protein
MDAHETLKKLLLKGESLRGKFTLYLNKKNMEEFKKTCYPLAPSKVIDELIREFLESKKSAKSKKNKSTKKS